MKRHFYVSLWLACAGCAGTTPQQSTMPDAEHGKSLEEFARGMFTHMDAGDFAYVKQTACPDAIMFDTDDKGAPISAWGKAAVDQTLDKYAQMNQQGAKISSQISRIQCEANASTGFCAIEFDQSMAMNGQPPMGPYKLRGVVTAMVYKDHWIWTSWHGSAREAPPAAAAMATAPAAAPSEAAPAAAPAAVAAPVTPTATAVAAPVH